MPFVNGVYQVKLDNLTWYTLRCVGSQYYDFIISSSY